MQLCMYKAPKVLKPLEPVKAVLIFLRGQKSFIFIYFFLNLRLFITQKNNPIS